MIRMRTFSMMWAGGLLAVFVLLTGCAQTQPTSFYTLASVDQTEGAASAKSADAGIIIGPVIVPKYLDRPQMIRRPDRYTLELADFDHWAEPLDDMISRVLVENLSVLLMSDQVYLESALMRADAAYQLELTVFRFDTGENNEAVLTARWNIVERRGEKMLVSRKSTYVEQAESETHDAAAAALSTTLAHLSRDIAGEFRHIKGRR